MERETHWETHRESVVALKRYLCLSPISREGTSLTRPRPFITPRLSFASCHSCRSALNASPSCMALARNCLHSWKRMLEALLNSGRWHPTPTYPALLILPGLSLGWCVQSLLLLPPVCLIWLGPLLGSCPLPLLALWRPTPIHPPFPTPLPPWNLKFVG